nr:Gfo/Idh/MocA family oxidoreductase [Anaerolineae bacterium]
MKNFALIGAAGYIAPRHLQAIHDTGNRLIAALDPHDSVGILDRYFPEASFFTEPERFDRFLDKRHRKNDESCVDYVTVCSPNYLHDAHIRMGLRSQAHIICEKPVVINPWNLDALQEIEAEMDRHVYTVLQLRFHEPIIQLKQQIEKQNNTQRAEVELTYITRRGRWYDYSWKGSQEKSGGIAMNIGIHFFDLCIWLFGACYESEVHLNDNRRMSGVLELERARVRWFLSIDSDDLPASCLESGKPAYRSMTIDGKALEFSSGFTDLHTVVYQEILAGRGFTIKDARPSIQLVYDLRHALPSQSSDRKHPLLTGRAL